LFVEAEVVVKNEDGDDMNNAFADGVEKAVTPP
jgi:hypothetical protein